jgi:indole-3-glycerol phosphate synthase
MSDLLAAAVASARRSAEERARAGRADVERMALERPRSGGPSFRAALAGDGLRVIAECKRRSPSRGVLRADYDPAAIARSYERAGAAAISVLTEPTFFDGALAHLRAVRDVVALPLLRKDFIVTDFQIVEARAYGADAVLVIVAALSDADLGRLLRAAAALDLDVLVEVHDEIELGRAVAAGAAIVGVNSRNLRTLVVSPDTLDRLAPLIPASTIAVAESGLRTRADLEQRRAAGYRAFLVGERLVTEPDPGAALAHLLGAAGVKA